jgi:predicted nuclease of predicted toxin-antitoxin system
MILREGGWDAMHTREIEMHEASDLDIPAYAAGESRVVTLSTETSVRFSR